MQKVCWRFKNSSVEPDKINEVAKKYSISSIMATVLLNRGLEEEKEIVEYIKKSLSSVHNPDLLPDMQLAADRIVRAIDNGEKITVYGDYDADGVTSTAVLYGFLCENGANADYYIPDRITEGYGLNIKAINRLSKLGTKLIITVDCGIASVGEVELAKAQKMEVIITDHHTCHEKIPNAYAVVNPKRQDSEYPFKELAGVGVAFKLILAITKCMEKSTKECFDKYVELAAIGTVADVVSLHGENRVITHYGVSRLPQTENFGIKALMKVGGIWDKAVTSTDIAFTLSPRINAAGRMSDAKLAVGLLLSKSDDEAEQLARQLNDLNIERQKTEHEIFNEALEMIDDNIKNKRIIVLAKEGWHHGVIGIVAARICEMYYKPCILISADNGKGKGSGRSVEGINLFEALSASDEYLTQFGGHSLAAGLSLDMKDFDLFYKSIDKYISGNVKAEPVKMLDVDCSVPSAFISVNSAKQLKWLEPYGMENEKPVFAMSGVEVISANTMGADNRHLKLFVRAGEKEIEAVGFSMGDYAKYLPPARRIDIAFNLEINNFRDTERVQLILKDIKSSK